MGDLSPQLADVATRDRLKATRVNPDALLTIAEVTALMNIGRTTFWRMRAAGKGPILRKLGRNNRVLGSDFLAWRDTIQ